MGITQEQFDSLLTWLGNGDRELGARKYETVRAGLVRVFISKGFNDAEDLADETLNRTARKIDEGEEIEKNVSALALGVAHFVFLETSRRPDNRRAEMEELITVAAPPEHRVEDDDLRAVYLRECMRGLSKDSRELIIEYYREEGRAKIEDRKALAEKLGISLNALFSRAKRIRDRLEQCVTRRIKRKPGGASIQRPTAPKAQGPGGDPQ